VQVPVQQPLESSAVGGLPSDTEIVLAASKPVSAPEQNAEPAALVEVAPVADAAAAAPKWDVNAEGIEPAAAAEADSPAAVVEVAPAAEVAAAAPEGDVTAQGIEPATAAGAESPAAALEVSDALPVVAPERAVQSVSQAPTEKAPEEATESAPQAPTEDAPEAAPVFEPAVAEVAVAQGVASHVSGEVAEGGAVEAAGVDTAAVEEAATEPHEATSRAPDSDAHAALGEQSATPTAPDVVLPVDQLMESNAPPGAAAAAAAAAECGDAAPTAAADGGTESSQEAPAEGEEQAAAPVFEPTEAEPVGLEAAPEGADDAATAVEEGLVAAAEAPSEHRAEDSAALGADEEGALAAAEALPEHREEDPAALGADDGATTVGQSADPAAPADGAGIDATTEAAPQALPPAQRTAALGQERPQKGAVRKAASKKPLRATSRSRKGQAADGPPEEVRPKPREQKPSTPPMPDRRAPPPPDDRATVGEITAGELRKASSGASLAGDETPQAAAAAGGTEPKGEDLAGLCRKSYGGVLVNGRFSKRHVAGVSQLKEREKEAILEDIRLDREARLRKIEERAKERPKQTGTSREEKLKQFRAEAEAMEEERKSKKAEALKEWLKKKEDQAREKKAREKEMLDMLIERERDKEQMILQAEQEQRKIRDSRLKWAESRKEKLKAGLLAPKEAAAPVLAEPSACSLDIKKSSSLPQLKPQAPAPKKPQLSLAQSQKVIHRHIHHHVHYHEEGQSDGADGDPTVDAYPSEEERRQIEMASEARVKAQLDASAKEFASSPYGSDVGLDGPSKPGSPFLPAVAGTDAARRRGLAKFAQCLQAAGAAYADIRRPNFGAAF